MNSEFSMHTIGIGLEYIFLILKQIFIKAYFQAKENEGLENCLKTYPIIASVPSSMQHLPLR